MNIEFNQILTFVSVVAAVYFAFKSNSRANNDEVSKKAQVDAILSQKLDSISDDTKEIRKEITDVIVTDPTTAGIGDSKQALTYETPKKEDAV